MPERAFQAWRSRAFQDRQVISKIPQGIYLDEAESLRTEQNQEILLQRAARKHFLQRS